MSSLPTTITHDGPAKESDAPAPPEIAWLDDFGAATAQARAQRRPILVDVYQEDCGGCDKLDRETLADPQVRTAIASRFIPVKLHLHRDRAFMRDHQVFWTPTILFADRTGRVRYTSVNYLPAPEFLDILDIGEAMVLMRWRAYDESIALLAALEYRSPSGALTAEAIYWRGVAAYFRDGKSSSSANSEWAELLSRFPDSVWAKRVP
jgi:hypothetical protein